MVLVDLASWERTDTGVMREREREREVSHVVVSDKRGDG